MALPVELDFPEPRRADDARAEAEHEPPTERGTAGGGALLAGAALCAGDVATFVAAWALLIPFGASAEPLPRIFALVAVVLLLIFRSQGLYPGYRVHGYEMLRRRAAATLRVCAVVCLAALLLSDSWRTPLLLAAYLAIALVAQPLARRFVRGLLWRSGAWGERVAILGDPERLDDVADYFDRHWQYGFIPERERDEKDRPAVAVVVGATPSPEDVASILADYDEVLLLADFPGLSVSGLRPAEIGGAIGLRLGGASKSEMPDRVLRRGLDVAVAALMLLAALPVLALAAVAIYAVDPGPVLYRQKREGLGGRQVKVLKLRTMYQDAEKRLETLLAADPRAREEWSTHFKLRDDPRVLPGIGGILRKTSVDELPQLLNVLLGDMSLVGPRPLPDYHLAAMEAPFQARRSSVMPGLTGLWQISERSAADLSRLQQLDEFYIGNRSFWLDLHILLKTPRAVIRGDGAY